MRKLKKPLLKNLIETIKSAFPFKRADKLPQALFANSEANRIKKELVKELFKDTTLNFEQELKSVVEYITSRHRSFGASFYSSHKPTASLLTLTVNTFYKQFGKPVKFKSPTAFFEGISLYLSERITSKVQKVKPEEKTEENFSIAESVLLENYRQQLLSQFSIPENFNDPTYGFMFKVAHNEFSSCSLSKVKSFVEILEQDKQKQKDFYTNKIKELEIEKITSKDGSLDSRIGYCKSILEYYTKVGTIESSFTFVRNKSLLNQPDNMLTILVDKKIDIEKFQEDISLLQKVNNILVCMNNGLLAKDIFFNGKNFICKNPHYDRNPFIVNNALGVIEQLPNLGRDTQSILAYDEDYIEDLLGKEKYPVTKVTVPGENGQTKELTLYSTSPIESPEQLQCCSFPMFVKSFTTSPTDENAEAILFAVAGPDIALSTQICRIDKVPPMYRGDVSKHKQTSGEMLETNTHIHGYNLFDKVTNFTPKKAGHFDISVNFNLGDQISNEQFEAFFDNWCSIPKKEDYPVLITETDEFKTFINNPQTSTEIEFIK